jgi:hypothetical protein
LKARDALRIFEKLEMEIREGRDTLAFFKWKGKTILWSKVPHKKGEMKGRIRHFIRQQLKLTEKQFQAVQECQIWRREYADLLQKKGLLEE